MCEYEEERNGCEHQAGDSMVRSISCTAETRNKCDRAPDVVARAADKLRLKIGNLPTEKDEG